MPGALLSESVQQHARHTERHQEQYGCRHGIARRAEQRHDPGWTRFREPASVEGGQVPEALLQQFGRLDFVEQLLRGQAGFLEGGLFLG
jgi:hypothetical protein